MEFKAKNYNLILFSITCILVFRQVISQAEEKLSTSQARTCKTIDNEPGKCISLMKCESIVNFIKEDPQVGRRIAAQLNCPGSGDHFSVCCPQTTSRKLDSSNYKPSTSGQWKANVGAALMPPQCGISNANHDRVVGGNPAELNAWPWIGIIGFSKKSSNRMRFKCGGSLISSRTVVTAAHCVYEDNDLKVVRLGEHNLFSNDDGAYPVNYFVQSTIVHPNYDPVTDENDIAILKLAKEVQFTEKIHPICLPVTEELKNRNYVRNFPFVAGWGATRWNGSINPILLEAQVPVVDNRACKAQYSRIINAVVDDRIICAGYAQGGKDSCQGDSGGPLMFPIKNTYYMIGVVSGGYKCAQPGYPGLYTRVTAFLDFIQKYMD